MSSATLDTDVQDKPQDEADVRQKEMEAVRHLAARDQIRAECRERLMACARRKGTAMSISDVHDYIETGLTEEKLSFAKTEKDKTEELRKYEKGFVPEFVKQAETLGRRALEALRSARSEFAISTENFSEWEERLKSGSWLDRMAFIAGSTDGKKVESGKGEFFDRVKRWKKVAEDRRKILKDPRIAVLKNSGILSKDELDSFTNGAKFLNLHYQKRVNLVNIITAALAQSKGGKPMEALKQEAKAKLEKAVAAGVLSANKVGSWMKRIFNEDHSMETIQNFLNGKGNFPLSTLVENWKDMKKNFDSLASMRKSKGTPRSFHFVSEDVFLDWKFDAQKTYIREAKNRFNDIEKEPEVFLKIRNELDTKDWQAAEELIEAAEGRNWSEEDQQKLLSLKDFLKEHRPQMDEVVEAKEQSPSPDAILEDIRGALDMIPFPHIRERFVHAMKHDYQTLWALCTMQYNWEWCRQHGYSSDEIDHDLRQTSKEETYLAEEEGVSRGHVNLDATTDTSVKVFRDDNDTRSAQAIHVDNTTDNEQLVQKIHQNKDNRAVWYWTRIMEKNVPFSFFQYMIHNIQPKIKSGMRKLDKMGYHFTETGPARKKDGTVHYASAAKKDEGAHYALAA